MTTGEHATKEACPLCHDEPLKKALEIDRALVSAFLAGILSRHQDTPIAEALCEAHAATAKEALGIMLRAARDAAKAEGRPVS